MLLNYELLSFTLETSWKIIRLIYLIGIVNFHRLGNLSLNRHNSFHNILDLTTCSKNLNETFTIK